MEEIVRSRRGDRGRAVGASKRVPPGVPPRALVRQTPFESLNLLHEAVELLELVHPGELETGEAQSLEPDDLQCETAVGGADALVRLRCLGLQPCLQLIGYGDACELVGANVARARHGQEHHAGHDGRRQAPAPTIGRVERRAA